MCAQTFTSVLWQGSGRQPGVNVPWVATAGGWTNARNAPESASVLEADDTLAYRCLHGVLIREFNQPGIQIPDLQDLLDWLEPDRTYSTARHSLLLLQSCHG